MGDGEINLKEAPQRFSPVGFTWVGGLPIFPPPFKKKKRDNPQTNPKIQARLFKCKAKGKKQILKTKLLVFHKLLALPFPVFLKGKFFLFSRFFGGILF